MNFTIIVTASATNSYSALNFVEAAISLQHTIDLIFFYQQGVQIANPFVDLPSDEINLQHRWLQLAQHYSLPLVICSASALRYGIAIDTLNVPFIIGSLGQLITTIESTQRVITFK